MASQEYPTAAYARAPRRIARPRVTQTNVLIALLPAVLFFYATITPAEVRFILAGQTLYPTRLVGFAVMPFVIYRMIREPIKWSMWDIVFFTGVFWMILSFIAVYGPGDGIRRGSALATNAFLPYIIGRCCIRDLNDLRRFLIFIAPGAIVVGLSLLAEVMTRRFIVRPAFISVFGALPNFQDGGIEGARVLEKQFRFGVLRAVGPFSHPILGGMFLATLLPLYWASGLRGWPKLGGIASGVLSVLSMSTTAFLGLIIGGGILALDYAQRVTRIITWRAIIPTLMVLTVILYFLTENGLIRFMSRFTLNPNSAHYRRSIWEYGTQSVMNNPWFGIGFEGYERAKWMANSTIDAHWLLLAVRHGLLPAAAIFGTAVAAVVLTARAASRSSGTDRNTYVGVAAAVMCVIIPGFAVSFFGGAQGWFHLLIAIGISVGVTAERTQLSRVRAPLVPRPPVGKLQRNPGVLPRSPAGPATTRKPS